MKILILSDRDINTLGGSQKSISTIVVELTKLGHKVALFMPVETATSSTDYQVFKAKKIYHKKGLLHNVRALKLAIKKFQPDIIHAQTPQSCVCLGLIKRTSRLTCPCIYTERGFLPERPLWYQKLLKFAVSKFDAITTTTEQSKKEWQKLLPKKPIICIPNVLEDNWFTYSSKTEQKIKQKLHVADKFHIGFSARYQDFKRWDTAYDIMKLLKDEPNIHFSIAITASYADLRQEMEQFLAEVKSLLGKKVSIYQDLPFEKTPEFYYSLDAFILTSRNESFGRTLIEAMTKNNIVIGTNSGGVPKVINNPAFLFEVGAANQACDILKKYIHHPQLAASAKADFRAYAKANFRTENMIKPLIDTYNSYSISQSHNFVDFAK